MGIGLIFWILMLIWLIAAWPGVNFGPPWGGSLLLFILLLLLGWHSFGQPIHG